MSKKKKNILAHIIDPSEIYICNMVVKGEEREEKTEVTFHLDKECRGYDIIPVNADKYESKYFYAVYVEFLMYQNYFVKKT